MNKEQIQEILKKDSPHVEEMKEIVKEYVFIRKNVRIENINLLKNISFYPKEFQSTLLGEQERLLGVTYDFAKQWLIENKYLENEKS